MYFKANGFELDIKGNEETLKILSREQPQI